MNATGGGAGLITIDGGEGGPARRWHSPTTSAALQTRLRERLLEPCRAGLARDIVFIGAGAAWFP